MFSFFNRLRFWQPRTPNQDPALDSVYGHELYFIFSDRELKASSAEHDRELKGFEKWQKDTPI